MCVLGGDRQPKYYIVVFWRRFAASGVSFLGFVRIPGPGPLGNKAAKRANPEGTKHFVLFNCLYLFLIRSRFVCSLVSR